MDTGSNAAKILTTADENLILGLALRQFEQGRAREQDLKAAATFVVKIADGGNVHAQYHLGLLAVRGKIHGEGAPDMAKHYLSLAAKQKHAGAELELAKIYFGERDYKQATRLLTPLVVEQRSEAMELMAICHLSGWGVKQSAKTASLLLERAKERKKQEKLNERLLREINRPLPPTRSNGPQPS